MERAFYLSWRKPVWLWGIQCRTLGMGRVIFLRTAVSFLPRRLPTADVDQQQHNLSRRGWPGPILGGDRCCSAAFGSTWKHWGYHCDYKDENTWANWCWVAFALSAWSREGTWRVLSKCWLDIFSLLLPWVLLWCVGSSLCCTGFSCCKSWALELQLRSCGSRA